MPLLAHSIRFGEPRSELVIDVGDVVEAKDVQMIPRGVRLDLAKSWTLHTSGQNEVAIEPSSARRDLRKRHPHLERNSCFLGQNADRTDAPDLGANGVEETADLRWLAFEVRRKRVAAACMRLPRVGKDAPTLRAAP